MLTSATGIGAVLAGIWLKLTSMCVAPFLLATTNWFWLGMVATGAAGFLMVVNGVTTQILIQYACAPEMLGRVLSIYGLSFYAEPALRALLMGAACEGFGLQCPLAVGAAICLGAWIWAFRHRGETAELLGEGALSVTTDTRSCP